jgi:hypothetical protein
VPSTGFTYGSLVEAIKETRMAEDTKVEYEQPEIADYGDLRDLTAAATTGGSLDATFGIHTPFGQLTFS